MEVNLQRLDNLNNMLKSYVTHFSIFQIYYSNNAKPCSLKQKKTYDAKIGVSLVTKEVILHPKDPSFGKTKSLSNPRDL